jgi:ribosomal-protein-alanine N-acetyltransferase
LREIVMENSEDLLKLRSDIDAMKYIDRPIPKSISEMHELVTKIQEGVKNNTAVAWGISLIHKNELIGTMSYHRIDLQNHRAEIGYLLNPKYWKTGLMSEAMVVTLDFGFNKMNLHSIEANVNPNNNASIALLKKFNFIKEAYFKENYYFNGKFLDSGIYSLLKK